MCQLFAFFDRHYYRFGFFCSKHLELRMAQLDVLVDLPQQNLNDCGSCEKVD